jgi:hypothetical protein
MEHDPWITLALAVVFQAMQDAQNGHPALANEAKCWLASIGFSWCQIMDVPEDILKNWASADFSLLLNPKRNWRY